MEKLNISIKIASLDSSVEYNVLGEYKNKRIKFIDPEQNTNYIIFRDDTVEYYKKGNVDMKYIFNRNLKTKGLYSVSGNKFEFEIETKELIVRSNVVYIKYFLYQGEELINETELTVEYLILKEE